MEIKKWNHPKKNQERKNRGRKIEKNKKTNTKMLYLNSNISKHISINTLYINGLNTPIKKTDF